MDAMPLFHHEAPLAPLLEVACAMVEAFCQSDQKLTIVGFYYAENGHSSSESGTGLSHFAEKVADRVEHQFSHACVLLVRLLWDYFLVNCVEQLYIEQSLAYLLNVFLQLCVSCLFISHRWTIMSLVMRRKVACNSC